MNKTPQELISELDVLKAELAAVTRQVNAIETLAANVQHLTTANVLGNANASDLIAAQREYEEATAAIPRKQHLMQAVREHERAVEMALAAEKRAFIDKIGTDFASVRERYVVESKKLLEIFKEMARLNNLSMSMRSHQLLFDVDWRLDLPALRSPNDSELFTVGSMVRDGTIR